jgi:hypothetical protein
MLKNTTHSYRRNTMTNLEAITAMIEKNLMDDCALEEIVVEHKTNAWNNAIYDASTVLHRLMMDSAEWFDEDRINKELHTICYNEMCGFFYGDVQDPINGELKVIRTTGLDNQDEAMATWSRWLDYFQTQVIEHIISSRFAIFKAETCVDNTWQITAR